MAHFVRVFESNLAVTRARTIFLVSVDGRGVPFRVWLVEYCLSLTCYLSKNESFRNGFLFPDRPSVRGLGGSTTLMCGASDLVGLPCSHRLHHVD